MTAEPSLTLARRTHKRTTAIIQLRLRAARPFHVCSVHLNNLANMHTSSMDTLSFVAPPPQTNLGGGGGALERKWNNLKVATPPI